MGRVLQILSIRPRVPSWQSDASVRKEITELVDGVVNFGVRCSLQAGKLVGRRPAARFVDDEVEDVLILVDVVNLADTAGGHDSTTEETLWVTVVQSHVCSDSQRSCALAVERHAIFVATEFANVLLHPLHGSPLVLEQKVGSSSIVEFLRVDRTECIETVVGGDEDDGLVHSNGALYDVGSLVDQSWQQSRFGAERSG